MLAKDERFAIQYGIGALCLFLLACLFAIQLISHRVLARKVGRAPLLAQRLSLVCCLAYCISFTLRCFEIDSLSREAIPQIFSSLGVMAAIIAITALLYETTRNAFLTISGTQSDSLPTWPFISTGCLVCLSVIISTSLALCYNRRIYIALFHGSTALFWLVDGTFLVYYCRVIIHMSQEKAHSANVQPPNLTNYYMFVCCVVLLLLGMTILQILEIVRLLSGDPERTVWDEKSGLVFAVDPFIVLLVLVMVPIIVWSWKPLFPDPQLTSQELRSTSSSFSPSWRSRGESSGSKHVYQGSVFSGRLSTV
eukprot:TRINITY_DN15213_c0_g1_i3.p1 TRINITY_DN15213_c0_g1~~TRINITY_DN15213_c0_g1_i3.p1  ORF type:complete len:309 (+),score=34.70 TRINITY_DN15213_c0_g1_i3:107-1033(+)